MIKKILFSFIFIVMINTVNAQSSDFTKKDVLKDFKKNKNLTVDKEYSDIQMELPTGLLIIEPYLFVADTKANHMIKCYDLNSSKLLSSFLVKGKEQEQVSTLQSVRRYGKDSIQIHSGKDDISKKVLTYAIKDVVAGKVAPGNIITIPNDSLYFKSMSILVNDKLFAMGNKQNVFSRFFSCDTKKGNVQFFGDYEKCYFADTTNLNSKDLEFGLALYDMKSHSDKQHCVVYSLVAFPGIEIMDLEKNSIVKSIYYGRANLQINQLGPKQRSVFYHPEYELGFATLVPTDRSIFALYGGYVANVNDMSKFGKCKYICEYDWNLNPIKMFTVAEDLVNIDIDQKSKYIYAIMVKDKVYKLVRYAL